MIKNILAALLFVSNTTLQAQVHGNPGGGGPDKGDENVIYCLDLKSTIEEYSKDLLKLEKREYTSDQDFFQYLDDEIFKLAISQWNILNRIGHKKDEKSKLLPCGKEDLQDILSEPNEKLGLLKKIRWTIKKAKNGHRLCQELFVRYNHRLPELESIIEFYENQEK